jgi:hypothetical protein
MIRRRDERSNRNHRALVSLRWSANDAVSFALSVAICCGRTQRQPSAKVVVESHQ